MTNFTLGVTNTTEYFPGSIGEVRVWSLSRSPAQIGSAMFQQLSGREEGLVGYWKLGAISEGTSRTVYDFSPSQTDGQVQGNAYVSSITLPNTHTAGTEYRNDDAIAVTRGAIYQESVEVRAVGGPLPAFKLAYWFKKSNDSLVPDATLPPITPAIIDLGNGWSRASCQFTVPAETSLMRTFEITEVADGAWTSLELRKHRLVQIPAAITESGYTYTASTASLPPPPRLWTSTRSSPRWLTASGPRRRCSSRSKCWRPRLRWPAPLPSTRRSPRPSRPSPPSGLSAPLFRRPATLKWPLACRSTAVTPR